MIIKPPTASTRQITQRILGNRAFDIEFQGYLSNHAKHAIIALDRLNAPDERIQEYWNTYTTLTPYNLPLHELKESSWKQQERNPTFTEEDWINLRGKKQSWQEMVIMLEEELKGTKQTSTHDLVRKYAPDLLDGTAGGLTHGIIHLGWALDANNSWMTLEGLAYLNFCHVTFGPNVKLESNAIQEDSPVESLVRICQRWEEEDLAQSWIEVTKNKYGEDFHPELVPAGFQWQVAKVLQDAHPIATQLPSWLTTKSLDFDDPDSVWAALYRAATLLYLATRDGPNGNFVVLHSISSLWGLEQVCRVFLNEDANGAIAVDSVELVRLALESYWAMTICLLATGSNVLPPAEQVADIANEFAQSKTDSPDYSWDETVARGIAEEEEHNIKLVYVTRELWKRYGRWSGFSEAGKSFTVTPNIGPAKTSFN